jgi:hypothetical protein
LVEVSRAQISAAAVEARDKRVVDRTQLIHGWRYPGPGFMQRRWLERGKRVADRTQWRYPGPGLVQWRWRERDKRVADRDPIDPWVEVSRARISGGKETRELLTGPSGGIQGPD